MAKVWLPSHWRALHALELELGSETRADNAQPVNLQLDEAKREIGLYGAVSDCGHEGTFSAEAVSRALAELGPGPITARINSPGGSAFEGLAIYNLLLDHEGEVTTIASALAASAASLIFAAGDNRLVAQGGRVMIHEARVLYLGLVTAKNIKQEADKISRMLASIDYDIAGIIAEASDLTREEAASAMAIETWYNASDSVEIGLATREYDGRAKARAHDPSALEVIAKMGAKQTYFDKLAELSEGLTKEKEPANNGSEESSLASQAQAILADKVRRDYQRRQ